MMRKQTAIFFILLANIILLAHAVIPHHHHEKKVCVNSRHCQSASNDYQHEASTHDDHQHDGESDSQVCALKQVVFIPTNQWDQYDNCLSGSDRALLFLDIQAVLPDNGFKAFVPLIVVPDQTDFNPATYFNFVSHSLGLRAPPVV